MWGFSRPMPAFVRFALIGLFNTLTDFSLFALLSTVFGWPPVLANLLSYSSGVVLSFTLNQRFTFTGTSRKLESTIVRLAAFYAGNLAGLALSAGLILLIGPLLGAIYAKAFSIPVVMVLNFVLAQRILATKEGL